jgi:hypothetical protein
MIIHTSLTMNQVYDSLFAAKNAGKITEDVYFDKLNSSNSRSHDRKFDLHIGTDEQGTRPDGKKRAYSNSGHNGANSGPYFNVWAATYDEWGWFLAELFRRDPLAKCSRYGNRDDFNAKTDDNYIL